LSPNGDGIAETIRFVPTLTIREGLSSWTLSAENRTEKGHVWTVSHVGPEAPPEWIEWNGRTDAGRVVDGRYAVTMVVEYEKGNRSETVLDTEIRIDTTSPQVAVTVSPQPFSPDDDGYDDVLTITPSVIDESRIRSWSVSIDDPVGTPFYRLARTGAVVPVAWNGRSDSGELVLSAEDYGLTVEAVDEFGNRGSVETRIPVDILVIRDGNRLRISISSIYFKPYTADYRDVPEVVAQKNLETLDRLSEILKKYPQHRIQLEGHAVRVLWYDESLWRTEEQDKLAPLSTARAEAIRDALIRRGIAAARMTTTDTTMS